MRDNAQYSKMKKYYLLLLLGSFWHTTITQNHRAADSTLLEEISQRSFQAAFTCHSRPSQGLLGEVWEGQIAIQDNKYRFTLPEQEVISDGQTVWTHLKTANEVHITDHDPEQMATAPWTVLIDYRQDYVIDSLHTQQTDGQACDVVDLVARDEEDFLQKITLTIERTKKHIKRLEILDINQNLHVFFMTYFVYDVRFGKSFFNFDTNEYQGIEIIDMR